MKTIAWRRFNHCDGTPPPLQLESGSRRALSSVSLTCPSPLSCLIHVITTTTTKSQPFQIRDLD